MGSKWGVSKGRTYPGPLCVGESLPRAGRGLGWIRGELERERKREKEMAIS
jgi:hypothetical protein